MKLTLFRTWLIIICLLGTTILFAEDFTIYPIPLDFELTNEKFDLGETGIVTLGGPEKPLGEIAQHLSSEVARRFKIPITWRKAGEQKPGKQTICLGLLSDPAMQSTLTEWDAVPDSRLQGSEAYQLVVTPAVAIVAGSDLSGLFYGVQSLIQLVEYEGQGKGFQGRAYIKGARISDKPEKVIRGVHVYLPARKDIPFFKNFIQFLAHYKLNTMIIEVGGGMRLDRHPEINIAWEHFTRSMYDMGDTYLQYEEQIPLGKDRRFQASTHTDLAGGSWLSKEEVRDIVDFARKHYLEVIPEIQGLSHAYYLALAHPEIAEPEGSAWPDSYDPANPSTYRLLFDVMDEYLEVFQPKFVHIGHDEWRSRIKGQPGNGEVFAQDVLKIYHHLQSRGIGTMMWADHLIRGHNLEGHGPDEPPVDSYVWYSSPSTEGAPEILAAAAKDIIMLNWSWGVTATAISQLKDHGWQQILGNFRGRIMYDKWESILSDDSILGAEISTWCGANEYLYALNDHFLSILFSQNILWSGRTLPINEVYEHLSIRMPAVRSIISNHPMPSRDVALGRTGYTFLPLNLPADTDPGERKSEPLDFSAIKPGHMEGSHFVFSIPPPENFIYASTGPGSGRKITVHSNAASILFLHVSSGRGEKLSLERTHYFEDKAELIGYYRIQYQDGLVESVPVRYGQNISHLGNGYRDQLYFAQTVKLGDSDTGEPLLASLYEWVCPRPNREIESIELIAIDSTSAIYPILIAATIVKPPFTE